MRKTISITKLLLSLLMLLPLSAAAQKSGLQSSSPVDEKGFTLSWPLGQGTDDVTSAEVKTAGLFSEAEFDCGKRTISQQRTAGASKQTL